jgi:hypothetical protein
MPHGAFRLGQGACIAEWDDVIAVRDSLGCCRGTKFSAQLIDHSGVIAERGAARSHDATCSTAGSANPIRMLHHRLLELTARPAAAGNPFPPSYR